MLQSGLVTYIRIETQYELSSLYHRIRLRNDLLLFVSKYAGHIVVVDSSNSERLKKKNLRHFVEITDLEKEIVNSLNGIEIMIQTEERKYLNHFNDKR